MQPIVAVILHLEQEAWQATMTENSTLQSAQVRRTILRGYNIALGYQALQNNDYGNLNIGIGVDSLSQILMVTVILL